MPWRTEVVLGAVKNAADIINLSNWERYWRELWCGLYISLLKLHIISF